MKGNFTYRKINVKDGTHEHNLFVKFVQLYFQNLPTINQVFLSAHSSVRYSSSLRERGRERQGRCCCWLIAERGVRRLSVCSNTLWWILQGCKQTSSLALSSIQQRTTEAAPSPLYFFSPARCHDWVLDGSCLPLCPGGPSNTLQ